MSYEYKEEILSDIGPEPNCNYESESNRYYDKIDELDRVYAQAAEYEAKAKAWDELSVSIRECNKEIELKGGLNAMFRTSKKGQIVQRHIDCFESGEYDD